MLGPRHLAQLLRHGECFGRVRLRLVRQKYLRCSFSLGLNGRLNRQARFVLFGNVLDRSMLRLLRLRRRAAFQREDHLADFYFLAFLDLDLFHCAGHRRRHFHHRLVGFQFHDRLAFGNFGAGRNHQPNQISLIDVLSQFGQFELGRTCTAAGSERRSRAAERRSFSLGSRL